MLAITAFLITHPYDPHCGCWCHHHGWHHYCKQHHHTTGKWHAGFKATSAGSQCPEQKIWLFFQNTGMGTSQADTLLPGIAIKYSHSGLLANTRAEDMPSLLPALNDCRFFKGSRAYSSCRHWTQLHASMPHKDHKATDTNGILEVPEKSHLTSDVPVAPTRCLFLIHGDICKQTTSWKDEANITTSEGW